ncbi:MBL fold metallo-hydrolase [Streptomyces sp. V1I1]|uniref:MBL fold metallo-hydrolase n=1 Tax=Streptomyces sp. V1I1 TaxID=3042272 RepID=UPI002784F66D|nr:ribonuclease Z [Streptomyces sp. V1I1]MDQ0940741.1 ribonuclease Z [Streptomyces sp. V1I1]
MEHARGTVHVLGSGSAKPSAARANSSYLIETGSSLLAIDCSGSPAHEILRHGLDPGALRHLYLTHGHVDHVYGLPSLIHSLWMLGLFREKPLAIHGTQETIRIARALLAPFGLEERRNAPRIDWRPVDADRAGELEGAAGLPVTAYPVTHGGTEAVGYRVLNTVFSGDAICDDRLVSAVDDSVRALVVDCGGGLSGNAGHAGAADIAELVHKRDRLESVLLTHIGIPSAEEDAMLGAFQGCEAEVRILSDGDRLELF